MAAIGWDAVTAALQAGELPCSGGERRISQLSARIAAGIPVSLRDTITALDQDNAARLLTAIRHTAGKRANAHLVVNYLAITVRTRSSITNAGRENYSR
jgi:hypothetical protein